jgi:hypothetical protein
LRRERLVEVLVQLARRVVRHVEQGDLRLRRFGAEDADGERGEEGVQAERGLQPRGESSERHRASPVHEPAAADRAPDVNDGRTAGELLSRPLHIAPRYLAAGSGC